MNMERRLKALKLLEAVSEECTVMTDGDHVWRKCRTCLARWEFENPEVRALIRELAATSRADTEGDRHQEPQDGLALTLQNDFLAIGRLIQDGRADFERIADWAHRLIQALGRYFHDDKLIMFDREGLIRFINERADTEWDRQACAAQLVADCEPFLKDGETPAECIARNRADINAVMSLLAKATAARADTEGDRPDDDRRVQMQPRQILAVHPTVTPQRAQPRPIADTEEDQLTPRWQPIDSDRPAYNVPVLVALIDGGKIMRVSDAKRDKFGFYTLNGGNPCHWRSHWMPLPDPPVQS
jgi:hypothetical protein